MSTYWNPDEALDEEEDDVGDIEYSGRNGVLFVVDSDPSIVNNQDSFESCLECIEAVMLNRIISAPKDLIGVAFYNTEHSPNPKSGELNCAVPANMAVLLPMQVISKSTINYIKNMLASNDFHDYSNRYGSSKSTNFSEMLWLCSRMLASTDYKLQSSTIVLFTNTEQPHPNGSSELQKSFVRAKDMSAMDVDLMLVPMVDKFDDLKFYRELICTITDQDQDDYRPVRPAEARINLCRRIFRRDMKRSCLRYFKWHLGDGLAIGCGVHSFTKTALKPRSVHMIPETNEIVEAKRVYKTANISGETRHLLPGELRKYQQLGGRRVVLRPEELATAKSMMVPGMKLLGFKPMAQLQPRVFVKATRLVYPSENQVKGSTRLFRALWERCMSKECFALCVFVQIRKVAPRYVALVPQTEEQDGSDGFRMIYLPMQTDSRSLDIFERKVPEVKEEAVVKMQAVMKKLKFKYDPTMFPDPHLEVFYADLEALVYEEPQMDCEDATMPRVADQDKRIGELVDGFKALFGDDIAENPKRAATWKAGNGTQPKVPKLSGTVMSKDDICSAISSGAIQKLTVAALKEFLQSEGVKGVTTMKKPDLIQCVKQHCQLG